MSITIEGNRIGKRSVRAICVDPRAAFIARIRDERMVQSLNEEGYGAATDAAIEAGWAFLQSIPEELAGRADYYGLDDEVEFRFFGSPWDGFHFTVNGSGRVEIMHVSKELADVWTVNAYNIRGAVGFMRAWATRHDAT
jgi:hypothetical protein